MRMRYLVGLLLGLAILLVTPNTTLAGGGGVDTRITTGDDPHWLAVRVYFDPKLFTCRGMVASFSFANPENGDVISGSEGGNSSKITNDASYETVQGKQYLRCSTYVKVHSDKLTTNRLFNISYNGENLEGGRTIALSFGSSFSESTLLPWENSSPVSDAPTPYIYFPTNLNLTITGQSPFTGMKGQMRHVFLTWTGEPGDNVYYRVYERPESDAPLGTAGWAYSDTTFAGPSGSVDLAADVDWYLRVEACTKTYPNKCINSPSVFLAKTSSGNAPFISSAPSPAPTVYVDKQVEELNKKVNALQKEVNASKTRQSALEQTVENLLKFIRTLFPFFGKS